MKGCLAVIGIYILLWAISFLISAGVMWLICWAFAWSFSWKIVFGIWLVMCLLTSIFKSTTHIHK